MRTSGRPGPGPADPRPARCAALAASLAERELDGLIVSHLPNVRYLTGFTGTAGLFAFLRDGEPVFLSDFRYATQAEAEVGGLARIEIVADDPWKRLLDVLAEYPSARTLAYEAHTVTVKRAEILGANGTRSTFKPEQRLVERLRAAKDPEEVRAIRGAATLAQEAFETVLPTVRVGQREIEIAARLEFDLRKRGSEWHPFPTIAASGPRSALPHATSSQRELQAGDWLLLDFGAQMDGYCADITRTVVVGRRADERQRAIYELVREAQRTARTAIRAGMTGREADALARSMIGARGFGDAFGHSLGHGLGLEVHEEPRVSATNDEVLPVGAVVTVEPGVYLPGWGGVRLEDDVHLTSDGAVLLSDGETELREVI